MPYRDTFKSTAWYYARYRRGYPPALFDALSAAFDLDTYSRVLDLGCGTGQIAIPLAQRVGGTVIAMDPEPEMLVEGAKQARHAGVTTIEWLEGGSEDIGSMCQQLGALRLVTMGRSFHWMNRDVTLKVLNGLVVPEGGIAIIGDSSAGVAQSEWEAPVMQVIRRWLGENRRAGSSTYRHPRERHEVVIARSPFGKLWTHHLEYQAHRSIESIIGYLYSTSYCSPSVLGDRREAFEQDLRETLLAQNPGGLFAECIVVEALLACRK